MTKDNEDALRCAERLECGNRSGMWYESSEAAAHLRRLVAENEANERNLEQLTDELSGCVKLLRQAVEALELIDGWLKVRHMGGLMHDEKAIQEAIRQHLEGKA